MACTGGSVRKPCPNPPEAHPALRCARWTHGIPATAHHSAQLDPSALPDLPRRLDRSHEFFRELRSAPALHCRTARRTRLLLPWRRIRLPDVAVRNTGRVETWTWENLHEDQSKHHLAQLPA